MTEEQYENLMYAISTLIGVIKHEAKPAHNGNMDLKTFEYIFEAQMKDEADKVYKQLTGKLPDSKWDLKSRRRKEKKNNDIPILSTKRDSPGRICCR